MEKKPSGKLHIVFITLAALCFAALLFSAVRHLAETNLVISEISSRAAALATPSPVPATLPPEIFETPVSEAEPAAEKNTVHADDEPSEELPQPDAFIYIDGSRTGAYYAGGDGTLYIPLSAFAQLACEDYSAEGTAGSFVFKGRTVSVEADSNVIVIDGETAEISAPAAMREGELYLPADAICDALGYGKLNDENNGINYYTYAAGKRDIPEGVKVNILMYWSIGDSAFTGRHELHVSPSDFAAQVEYLYYNNYSFITFEDLDSADSFEKPVMLTFNNGYEDFYTEVYPVLQQYGIKATVFVITDNIGTGHCLTQQQLREMSQSGLVSVQSQTANGLHQKYAADIRTNYAHSRLVITEITGIEPIALCYPNGVVSNDAFLLVSEYYRYGVAGGGPAFITGSDTRMVYRTYVMGGETLERFVANLG